MFWGLFFRHPLISASILASFWKPFSINVHNFFGINFCMFFLNLFSASDACFCQCPPVSCIKIIASTARISRCRRSPRTTIRRHRPVSGVSDKGSQHCEAPPSEACPPYLPASIWIIKMASKIIILRFIFGIKFWHHFWHAFFPTFYAFWCPFGSPLAPFGHFGCILGSILAPFWLTFASNLHTFF